MKSIEELETKLKEDVAGWEEGIFHWVCDLARSMAKARLYEIEEESMRGREEGLEVAGLRERWVTTLFGDVRIRRRLYRDREGNYRFLLDEATRITEREPSQC